MNVTFNLSHVFYPESSPEDDSYVLKALLDCLIQINLEYVRKYHPVPLYQAGVVYGRTTIWDPIPALYHRGYGDCKSLSAALIAEKLNSGLIAKPVFRFYKRSDGGKNFHILVLTEKNNTFDWEDPSRVLGMGKPETSYFNKT